MVCLKHKISDRLNSQAGALGQKRTAVNDRYQAINLAARNRFQKLQIPVLGLLIQTR
jgi:hypothetical protein